VVRRNVSGQDLQQRGFAGAVAADDGDTFARINLQGCVHKQRQVTEGVGQFVGD